MRSRPDALAAETSNDCERVRSNRTCSASRWCPARAGRSAHPSKSWPRPGQALVRLCRSKWNCRRPETASGWKSGSLAVLQRKGSRFEAELFFRLARRFFKETIVYELVDHIRHIAIVDAGIVHRGRNLADRVNR